MFKEYFKYYKSRKPPPSLDNVLDVDKYTNLSANEVNGKSLRKVRGYDVCPCPASLGLKKPSSWDVYELLNKPGLIFIRNPFTTTGQRQWICRCLRDYSVKPNRRNIDDLLRIDDWWEEAQNDPEIRKKLRWVTLGFHHNWDTKIYSDDEKGEFPKDLKDMVTFVATVLGYSTFQAEAAIVNYYHMDSTLSGHTDHSEANLDAPLFSFSFGQSAIFLVGGETLNEKPLPILLRSGDIVVMSKQARRCFHGVPKILQADSQPWENDSNWPTLEFTEDPHKGVLSIFGEAVWLDT